MNPDELRRIGMTQGQVKDLAHDAYEYAARADSGLHPTLVPGGIDEDFVHVVAYNILTGRWTADNFSPYWSREGAQAFVDRLKHRARAQGWYEGLELTDEDIEKIAVEATTRMIRLEKKLAFFPEAYEGYVRDLISGDRSAAEIENELNFERDDLRVKAGRPNLGTVFVDAVFELAHDLRRLKFLQSVALRNAARTRYSKDNPPKSKKRRRLLEID